MTIKIQAFQAKGIKTDKIIDRYEFCCWQSLYEWLNGFASLHQCKECKERLNPSLNNDFIQDPLIERIKELQKDPKFIKEINVFIKEHTS